MPETFVTYELPDIGSVARGRTFYLNRAAALLRSRAPQLMPQQIITVLCGTAGVLRDLVFDPVPSPSYGSGLIDLAVGVGKISP
jgi:hypothetical protein